MSENGSDRNRSFSVLTSFGQLLAGGSSAIFILVAVSISVLGWQDLYATPQRLSTASNDIQMFTSGQAIYLFLAGLAGVGVLMFRRGKSIAIPGPGRRGSMLATTGLALLLLPTADILAQIAWYYLGDLWPAMRPPQIGIQVTDLSATWSGTALYVAVVSSAVAALAEELCALAVPIWLARSVADVLNLGQSWRRFGLWGLGVLLVVIRISYHVYQGPPAFAHLPWAVATVVLYVRTRQLVPIIAAHFASDLVLALETPLTLDSFWQWAVVSLTPTLLVGMALLAMNRRTRSRRVMAESDAGRSDRKVSLMSNR